MPNQNPPVPSRRPGEDEDADGAVGFLLKKALQKTNNQLPARIISYDRDRNRAQVEILYQLTYTNGINVQMQAPAQVPVVQIGGGGMVLNFPLNKGDLGWIKASDRDISLFLQSYGAERGNTPRMHDFADGVFYPDVMKGWAVDDPAAAVLQTLDGGTAIALKGGRVMINVEGCIFTITPDGVTCNKPITAPQFSGSDGVNLIGHNHSDSSGDTIGVAKNP